MTQRGYATRFVVWTLTGFAGVGLGLLGGLRDNWPAFGIGIAVACAVIFMLGTGRFLPPAVRRSRPPLH